MIKELPGKRLQILLQVHHGKLLVNKADVLQAVKQHLPRSKASFRTREDYEAVFGAVDLRNRGLPRAAIAPLLWSEKRAVYDKALAVQDLERTFQHLAETFSIPL